MKYIERIYRDGAPALFEIGKKKKKCRKRSVRRDFKAQAQQQRMVQWRAGRLWLQPRLKRIKSVCVFFYIFFS